MKAVISSDLATIVEDPRDAFRMLREAAGVMVTFVDLAPVDLTVEPFAPVMKPVAAGGGTTF